MRKCPVCQGIVSGRSDKIYCSNACRIKFYTDQNQKSKKIVQETDSILHRNRKILKQFKNEGTHKITRYLLQKKGFNFYHFTQLQPGINCNDVFCYDIG